MGVDSSSTGEFLSSYEPSRGECVGWIPHTCGEEFRQFAKVKRSAAVALLRYSLIQVYLFQYAQHAAVACLGSVAGPRRDLTS